MIGGCFTALPENTLDRIDQAEAPLTVKFGIDPTRDRIHLGHFVPLRVVRALQDQGHIIHIILGTFTAQMGDPSGRDKTRPILDAETVKANGEALLAQISRILAPGFEVHRNHEWHEVMTVPHLLTRICSKFTVAGIMARDGFRTREGVSVHEMIVPMLQGWDSVELDADIEIGGTDQLFNFQVTRQLQASEGQAPEGCLMTPVINGTDGRKMSKSFGNCIFLDEAPEQIFGKVMSISDEVMEEWIPLLCNRTDLPSHPMHRKQALAADIVTQIHGAEAARQAAEHFKRAIQEGQAVDAADVASGTLLDVVMALRSCSKTQARRLVAGGGVRIDGERQSDPTVTVSKGAMVRIGKRTWGRVA